MNKEKRPKINRKNTHHDFHLWVSIDLGKAIRQKAKEENRTFTGQIRNDLQELYEGAK